MMGLTHQFIFNRQGFPNGIILRESGLLQTRQKKRQAVWTFRVTFRRLVADAISMTVETHDHSV
jgi:hypothetical protein